MNETNFQLVLVRHGHSEWNLSHRFTGWTDIPLTEVGLTEAKQAGQRLASEGFEFDAAHISVLTRTRQTAETILEAARHPAIPFHETWRLNERHYGCLQGMGKEEIFAAWGEERSRRWWRGYFDSPPELDEDDSRHPRFDSRYDKLDPALLPRSESLSQCQARLLPYWNDVLALNILAGQRLLVISHGNTLRSLRMHLENIDPDAIEQVEIPPGIPLVYRLNKRLEPIGMEWLE